ncbi:hypothetical protein BH18ACI4_BH18ACI4_19880 [soil metagenome]
MHCPRCGSSRVQRGYKDMMTLFRLAGLDERLCTNCGLEFKSFDSSGRPQRAPTRERSSFEHGRSAPRYSVHLPATIRFAERQSDTGKISYSQPSRGHCTAISKIGLALSLSGSRLAPGAFSRTGRLLLVSIALPNGPIDALVTSVRHEHVHGERGKERWVIGASITQMSEADEGRLSSYLKKRAEQEPLFDGPA